MSCSSTVMSLSWLSVEDGVHELVYLLLEDLVLPEHARQLQPESLGGHLVRVVPPDVEPVLREGVGPQVQGLDGSCPVELAGAPWRRHTQVATLCAQGCEGLRSLRLRLHGLRLQVVVLHLHLGHELHDGHQGGVRGRRGRRDAWRWVLAICSLAVAISAGHAGHHRFGEGRRVYGDGGATPLPVVGPNVGLGQVGRPPSHLLCDQLVLRLLRPQGWVLRGVRGFWRCHVILAFERPPVA